MGYPPFALRVGVFKEPGAILHAQPGFVYYFPWKAVLRFSLDGGGYFLPSSRIRAMKECP